MPNQPTLINLPPPPSDPVTPSDIPGTPTSTTTSMSELSTVAIKDGHRGHLPHHSAHHTSQPTMNTNNLDAERADRISRLAGLERVTTARNPTPISSLTPGAAAAQSGNTAGYFDQQGNPVMGKERSTVGSASATGSVGGRTTWASGSDVYDHDKMSESQDMDMDTGSVGGMSDEGTNSLVGFGEGARTPARQSAYGSPSVGKATPIAGIPPQFGYREASMTPVNAHNLDQQDAQMSDASAFQSSNGNMGGMRGGGSSGVATAERIIKEHLGPTDGADRVMESPVNGAGLGKFEFEKN